MVSLHMHYIILILFENLGAPFRGSSLTNALELSKNRFQDRFESTFGLMKKGFSTSQIQFGQMLLSNMIGGIG